MEMMHVLVLALIQGITEFLPISSSAHLILPSQVLGWPDQGLAFDVAVHVGTLLAVVIYFRADILELIEGWFKQFTSHGPSHESKLAWCIVLATIPVGLVGLAFEDFIEAHFRSTLVIALSSIVFGLLLWAADVKAKQNLTLQNMTLLMALCIGVAQAFALIPGTSRSGATMTMALFLGFSRTDSAKFSFLMSIPVITLSGLLEGFELLEEKTIDWSAVVVGLVVSGISAYLCIHYFLSFISRLSMLPFVIYRIILGVVLLAITFG